MSANTDAMNISVSHSLSRDRLAVTFEVVLKEFLTEEYFKELLTKMINLTVAEMTTAYVQDHRDELRKAFAHARIEKMIADMLADTCVGAEIERIVSQRVNRLLEAERQKWKEYADKIKYTGPGIHGPATSGPYSAIAAQGGTTTGNVGRTPGSNQPVASAGGRRGGKTWNPFGE